MIMVITSENFMKVNMASLVSAVLGSTTTSIGVVLVSSNQIVEARSRGQRILVNRGGCKKLRTKELCAVGGTFSLDKKKYISVGMRWAGHVGCIGS
jgi:hypothetical protein